MFRKLLLVIAVSVAALTTFAGAEAYSQKEAERHYKRGERYYRQGRYKDATDEFQKALDILNKASQLPKEKTRQKVAAKKTTPEVEQAPLKEYYIDIEDTLDVSIWKVPDLSRSEVIVRPDGKISMPLVGDLPAAGRTLNEIDEELTRRYAEYVREPQISVMIRKFGGKKVIVLGDVAKPGVYTYNGDIRVMEAIALAGDVTKYAVKNQVLVIRGDVRSNPKVLPVNLLSIIKNAKLKENIQVQPQDIVFVPRTFIGNVYSFLETIYPLVDAAYKAKTTQVFWRTDGLQKTNDNE